MNGFTSNSVIKRGWKIQWRVLALKNMCIYIYGGLSVAMFDYRRDKIHIHIYI